MADDHARKEAVELRKISMALTAGAGAGKTRILVDRVLGLLRDGALPHRIAAITFTEAAAGEARKRIREELEKQVLEDPSNVDLLTARAALGRMSVTTIHAFALEMIRSEALSAGWLPSTRLTDSMFQTLPLPAARNRWKAKLRDDEPQLLECLRNRGIKTSSLDQMLTALVQFRDLDPVVCDVAQIQQTEQELLQVIRQMHDLADQCTAPDTCRLLAASAAVRERIRRDDDGRDLADRLMGMKVFKAGRSGRRGDWPANSLTAMRQAHKRLHDLLNGIQADPHTLGRIVDHARTHFLPLFEDAKRQAALADFDDILFVAEDLLRSNPQVWSRASTRYTHILIDEVQDTDPLQAAIVARLAQNAYSAEAWEGRPLVPGRLFAVGDEAQSIYRFRRAERRTWNRLRNTIGENRHLVRNHRSVPGIIDFVNEAFKDVPEVSRQDAVRGPADLDPVVLLRPTTRQADDENTAVVDYVAHLVANHGVQPRDVMVVLPSWTRADSLQDAFSGADLPSFVDGGTSFFERHETNVALAILGALLEPGDSEAVVGTLRGAFGHSFEDLARHKHLSGSWRYTLPCPSSSPIADAMHSLERAHRMRNASSLVEPMDQVLEESGVLAVWSLRSRGSGILANIEKLRSLIRELELAGKTGLQVLDAMTTLRGFKDKESDLPLRPFESDAIEITTVFKAKGRQARVVVLAHGERAQREQAKLVRRESNELAVSMKPFLPMNWDAMVTDDKAEDAQERLRWMYVAATRAEDQLVIPWHEDRKLNEPSDLIGYAFGPRLPNPSQHEDGTTVPVGPAFLVVRKAEAFQRGTAHRGQFGTLQAPIEDALAKATSDLADVRAEAESQSKGFELTRSALLRQARERSVPWRSVKEIAEARVRRRGLPFGSRTGEGKDVGSLVHRVLENVDLRSEDARQKVYEELPVQARLGGASQAELAKAGELLQAILTDALFQQLQRAPEVWQETPFAHTQTKPRQTVVNGVIDLLFPTDATRERWIIVDWKTDRPVAGTQTEAVYMEQLELYARGFLETWQGHPVRVDTRLVGPVDPVDPWDEAFEEAHDAVYPLLQALKDSGAPAPVVGHELDGSPLELAWPSAHVAVVIEPNTLPSTWECFTPGCRLDDVLKALQEPPAP